MVRFRSARKRFAAYLGALRHVAPRARPERGGRRPGRAPLRELAAAALLRAAAANAGDADALEATVAALEAPVLRMVEARGEAADALIAAAPPLARALAAAAGRVEALLLACVGADSEVADRPAASADSASELGLHISDAYYYLAEMCKARLAAAGALRPAPASLASLLAPAAPVLDARAACLNLLALPAPALDALPAYAEHRPGGAAALRREVDPLPLLRVLHANPFGGIAKRVLRILTPACFARFGTLVLEP